MNKQWGDGYASVQCATRGILHHALTDTTTAVGRVQLNGNNWLHWQQRSGFFHGPLVELTAEVAKFRSDIFPTYTLTINRSAYDKMRQQFN